MKKEIAIIAAIEQNAFHTEVVNAEEGCVIITGPEPMVITSPEIKQMVFCDYKDGQTSRRERRKAERKRKLTNK